MPVDSPHLDYTKHAANWSLVRDFVSGEDAVKAARSTYLPIPEGRENAQNRARGVTPEYDKYVQRATFLAATAKTVEGMIGTLFRKPPTLQLPAALAYLTEDADGCGTPLADVAKKAAAEVSALGRVGVLVDYPSVDGVLSLADERQLRARAQIFLYRAEDVVNWRTDRVDSESRLTLLVLREYAAVRGDDEFSHGVALRYRVYRLEGEGVSVEVYEKRDRDFVSLGRTLPRLPGGKALQDIPFIFLGSQDLTPDVDKSPVLDIARVNLAHYRNSADYEDALFMLGQPTPWIVGLTQEWVDKNMREMVLGSRQVWGLPVGAQVGLLELTNNLSAFTDALGQKERQMAALGARIFSPQPDGVEAADTVRLRQSGEASILSALSSNVSRAFNRALAFCGDWMGATVTGAEFSMNSDFFAVRLSAPDLAELVKLWQGGAITFETLFQNLVSGEIIAEQTNAEDYREKIETETPLLPDVPDVDEDTEETVDEQD